MNDQMRKGLLARSYELGVLSDSAKLPESDEEWEALRQDVRKALRRPRKFRGLTKHVEVNVYHAFKPEYGTLTITMHRPDEGGDVHFGWAWRNPGDAPCRKLGRGYAFLRATDGGLLPGTEVHVKRRRVTFMAADLRSLGGDKEMWEGVLTHIFMSEKSPGWLGGFSERIYALWGALTNPAVKFPVLR